MAGYSFQTIEAKWQQRWEEEDVNRAPRIPERPKFYCLEMLPYPSGQIHMGHVRNYSIGDVVARNRRMRGFDVLHPIGWDALGLPAENAAIEKSIHPAVWTRNNIEAMRRQLHQLGFSYDWSREIATYQPQYYRWNQWLFLQFWKRGLAYRKEGPVNWCPSCATVLANEQVEDGLCWRCDSQVEERRLAQWFFKITSYAEELLEGLESLPLWPQRVRTMQRNWIGRSDGAEVRFQVEDCEESLTVFTTRIDTIFGATFLLVAPEHPLVQRLLADNDESGTRSSLTSEVESIKRMRRHQDYGETLEKVGVFTGRFGRNPYNDERLPIWAANFVLMDYGTGAVMAVPAHDSRDFEFARKYDLPIRAVVEPRPGNPTMNPEVAGDKDGPFTADGVLSSINGPYAELDSARAREHMIADAQAGGFGGDAVDYKLKDWGISRQRYWGTPIPMIHCRVCGTVPVPEENLPVLLPEDVELAGTVGSALAGVEQFVKVDCPQCGAAARRETDTMDTFVDSSWYYLRYISPQHATAPFDPEEAAAWMPVDLYIGGVEHAVLHLLYYRFFCKAMRDLGLLSIAEPASRQLSQGMVTKDGAKMSKSRGNVVDPDTMVKRVGADTIRLFVLFAAPPVRDLEWDEHGIEGCSRFLNRVWTLVDGNTESLRDVEITASGTQSPPRPLFDLHRKVHEVTRKVTRDVEEELQFNTAIAALMELTNECYAANATIPVGDAEEHAWVYRLAFERLIVLLSPFAPYIAHELWERLGGSGQVAACRWPHYDAAVLERDQVILALQVDGRLRSRLQVAASLTDEAELASMAMADPVVQRSMEGRTLVRTVVVPGRIINLVTRR